MAESSESTGAWRLLGKWRSNRERTLAEWSFPDDAAGHWLERSLGKLVIHYTQSHVRTEFEGDLTDCRYRVTAVGLDSVSIVCETEPVDEIRDLHFVSPDMYWVSIGSNREYFSRIDSTNG